MCGTSLRITNDLTVPQHEATDLLDAVEHSISSLSFVPIRILLSHRTVYMRKGNVIE